ncbi:hypothetical protein V8C86DRAFT_2757664, partial [Haematococcus lacustris]
LPAWSALGTAPPLSPVSGSRWAERPPRAMPRAAAKASQLRRPVRRERGRCKRQPLSHNAAAQQPPSCPNPPCQGWPSWYAGQPPVPPPPRPLLGSKLSSSAVTGAGGLRQRFTSWGGTGSCPGRPTGAGPDTSCLAGGWRGAGVPSQGLRRCRPCCVARSAHWGGGQRPAEGPDHLACSGTASGCSLLVQSSRTPASQES